MTKVSRLYSFKKYNFIIAFHEAIAVGPSFDLKKFLFLDPPKNLLFISHPLLYNKETYKNSSWHEYFEDGKLVFKRKALHWILPEPLLYVKDTIYSLVWCLTSKIQYNVFIGLNPLNALVGLILRKINRVEKVVYYSIDYFPKRFENPIMNKIYHFIDKISVKYADETWNVSPNMTISRLKLHNDVSLNSKQFTVPIGIWFRRTKRKSFRKINKKKLVFLGLVDKPSGIELIVEAMPKIEKKLKDVELEIIGGGPNLEFLKKLAKQLNIDSKIRFYGWVTDRKKLEDLLSSAAVGLALFNTKIFRMEIRNADPMKIKDYMVMGMPIISTDAISNYKDIQNAQCGIIIRYDVEELVEAVVKLLRDENLLLRYRNNAVKYVEKFDIEKLYCENLKRLLA